MPSSDKINSKVPQKSRGVVINSEVKKTIKHVIDACGNRTAKDKVNILYLTIDHLFEQHKNLRLQFCDFLTVY
jgi:hypothetical protein